MFGGVYRCKRSGSELDRSETAGPVSEQWKGAECCAACQWLEDWLPAIGKRSSDGSTAVITGTDGRRAVRLPPVPRRQPALAFARCIGLTEFCIARRHRRPGRVCFQLHDNGGFRVITGAGRTLGALSVCRAGRKPVGRRSQDSTRRGPSVPKPPWTIGRHESGFSCGSPRGQAP